MRAFLVTGTGRCGTAWVSQALQAVGINCGHEKVYGANFNGWRRWEGDSSLCGCAYLDDHDGPIAHLVREPLAVLNSWLRTPFFADVCDCHRLPYEHRRTPYAVLQRRWVGDIDYLSPHETVRACRYVMRTNELLMDRGIERFRLEDLTTDPEAFAGFVWHLTGRIVDPAPALELPPANTGNEKYATEPRAVMTYEDFPELEEHARQLGYVTVKA